MFKTDLCPPHYWLPNLAPVAIHPEPPKAREMELHAAMCHSDGHCQPPLVKQHRQSTATRHPLTINLASGKLFNTITHQPHGRKRAAGPETPRASSRLCQPAASGVGLCPCLSVLSYMLHCARLCVCYRWGTTLRGAAARHTPCPSQDPDTCAPHTPHGRVPNTTRKVE